jgi:hypothetical protein
VCNESSNSRCVEDRAPPVSGVHTLALSLGLTCRLDFWFDCVRFAVAPHALGSQQGTGGCFIFRIAGEIGKAPEMVSQLG